MNPLRRSLKRVLPPQAHPDPQLQFWWDWTQWAILLLPLSSFLGGVSVLLIVLVMGWQLFPVLRQRRINQGLAIVSLLMLFSATFAQIPAAAFLGLFNFLPFFLAFAVLSELLRTPDQLRRLTWILVAGSVPVVIIGLGQQWLGWHGHVQLLGIVVDWLIRAGGNPPGRMSSVFFYANVLANYLVVTFILALGLWIEAVNQRSFILKSFPNQRQWLTPKLLLLTGIVMSNAIALILTNSRNGWAIAAIACLALALYQGWRWLLVGVGAATSAVLMAAFAPSPIREGWRTIVPAFFWARLTDELYPNRPERMLRSTQWKFAWSMAEQRPWLGWGLRNFTPLYKAQVHSTMGHPHNLTLMLMAETGIPATIVLVSIVGWVVAQGSRYLLNWHSGAASATDALQTTCDRLICFTFLVAFMGCGLFSLFDVTLFDARINLIGWLLLAGICGMVYHSPEMKPKRST
ncbi:O-antigen ligase family protein [Pantanalinema sp. GBBB05]|uniref:O-antigen ligase family protein n=1 Tax=Pantanalinema sp. GBBB05 TaxID=2604139 RepID=UPI001DE90205|nr:O-antigen ligase family protein [Pantanalinema sp. GBBB05]